MIDGVMGMAEYQCIRLLESRYFRLESALSRPIGLDDAAAVTDLIASANSVDITKAVNWLNTAFA
jgi:hypothetical protein